MTDASTASAKPEGAKPPVSRKHAPIELDPMIHKGNHAVKMFEQYGRGGADRRVMHGTVLVSVPFLTFLVTMLNIWWLYHDHLQMFAFVMFCLCGGTVYCGYI